MAKRLAKYVLFCIAFSTAINTHKSSAESASYRESDFNLCSLLSPLSEQACDKVITSNSTEIVKSYAFMYKSEIYSKKQDYDLALENAEYAIKLNPEDGILHEWIGSVFIDKNMYTEADAAFDKAIRLGINAYCDKSELSVTTSEYAKALQQADTGLAYKHHNLCYGRAIFSSLKLNQLKRAQKYYDLYASDPERGNASKSLILYKKWIEKYQELNVK